MRFSVISLIVAVFVAFFFGYLCDHSAGAEEWRLLQSKCSRAWSERQGHLSDLEVAYASLNK